MGAQGPFSKVFWTHHRSRSSQTFASAHKFANAHLQSRLVTNRRKKTPFDHFQTPFVKKEEIKPLFLEIFASAWKFVKVSDNARKCHSQIRKCVRKLTRKRSRNGQLGQGCFDHKKANLEKKNHVPGNIIPGRPPNVQAAR